MWYVLQTMTKEEERCRSLCEKRIDSQCYSEIFIPTSMTKKHFKKEWHDVKQVLFPGYVFVDTGNIEEFAKELIKVECFSKLLKTGDDIVPVAEEEQKFLESLMDVNRQVGYSQGIIIGDKVVITEGALRNQSALIRKVDRHRRIAMLEVNMFGRPTPVQVGFGAFAKVTEEEREKARQENMDQYEEARQENLQGERIRVLSGAFEGMKGKLTAVDEARDAWTTEIVLFGNSTKVVFAREEIEILSG